MTFPTHVASTAYTVATPTDAWTAFTGQNFSGQFLLFVVEAGKAANNMSTASSGWVELTEISDDIELAIFYKESGSASEELIISNVPSSRYAAVLIRFTDADAVSGTAITYTSAASPNPPAHTLSESTEAIWIAVAASEGGATATSAPSGYSGLTSGSTGNSANDASISIARKQLEASSENPGTFTMNDSNDGIAMTLAVYLTQGQGYSGAVI